MPAKHDDPTNTGFEPLVPAEQDSQGQQDFDAVLGSVSAQNHDASPPPRQRELPAESFGQDDRDSDAEGAGGEDNTDSLIEEALQYNLSEGAAKALAESGELEGFLESMQQPQYGGFPGMGQMPAMGQNPYMQQPAQNWPQQQPAQPPQQPERWQPTTLDVNELLNDDLREIPGVEKAFKKIVDTLNSQLSGVHQEFGRANNMLEGLEYEAQQNYTARVGSYLDEVARSDDGLKDLIGTRKGMRTNTPKGMSQQMMRHQTAQMAGSFMSLGWDFETAFDMALNQLRAQAPRPRTTKAPTRQSRSTHHHRPSNTSPGGPQESFESQVEAHLAERRRKARGR